MSASKWTTTKNFYEIRVSGDDVNELRVAAEQILAQAEAWHGDDQEVRWFIEDGAVLFQVAAGTLSVGGWS